MAMWSAWLFAALSSESFAVLAAKSSDGSCGANPTSDCLNDMASCGNACCAAEFSVDLKPQEVFDSITSYLKSGGSDGLFTFVGGAAGLEIASPDGAWTATFQGKHQTFVKKYNDTLDFAIRAGLEKGSTVRIFSISDIAGALGDMGQNHRTVSMMGTDLAFGSMKVLFGCGASPSLPTSVNVATAVANIGLVGEEPVGLSMSTWMDRAVSALIGAASALVLVQMRVRARTRAYAMRGEYTAQYYLVA